MKPFYLPPDGTPTVVAEKPLASAVKAALAAARHLGWMKAMQHIAIDTDLKAQLDGLVAEAAEAEQSALLTLARQLTEDGFRP